MVSGTSRIQIAIYDKQYKDELHPHPLRHHVRAVNQVVGIVKDPLNGGPGIGVAGVRGPQKLLAVLLLDFEALAEEGHLRLPSGASSTRRRRRSMPA